MTQSVLLVHRGDLEPELRATFEGAGFRVWEATSDQEVQIAAAVHRPCAILVASCPADAASGCACRWLVQNPASPPSPMILLCGDRQNDDCRVDALEQGADVCLPRTASPRLVLAQVRALVRAEILHGPEAIERALRESEARFRRVVENIRDGLFVDDASGRVVFANDRFLEMFGFSRDDLENLHLEDYVAPEYREQLRARHEARVRGDAAPGSFEYDGLRRDGTRMRLEVDVVPVMDEQGRITHTQSAIRDITERRRADERLRDSEQTFRAIFNAVYDGIVLHETDGRILDINDRFMAMYGVRREEVIGRTVVDSGISAPGSPFDQLPALWARAVGGEHQLFEWRGRRPADGSEFEVEVFLRRIRLHGTDLILANVRDITERKRAEEALREADRRKTEFIAVLSHELRNPLAPIRYALPLLRADRLGDAATRALAVVDRQVTHLTRLVDDLLDVSRITRGKIELRREPVTLSSILNAASEAAAPAIHAARHRLSIKEPDDPVWIMADAARIAQVVTNLLNNSAKYTPRGGEIALEASVEQGHCVIRVRDNGIGIPRNSLGAVFEMFRQVDGPNRAQGGLGIGLALARRIVEMHGGTIEGHSAGRNQGSEFVVRLPLAPAAADSQDARQRSQAATPTRRLKVLVVDDNVDLVEMLAVSVERAGHEVRKALDGRSALSAALSYRPDVVLLDLGLPVLDGLEVAREIRRTPGFGDTFLVALTGWGQQEDRAQTMAAGFNCHLTKPTDPADVERLLARFASAPRPA